MAAPTLTPVFSDVAVEYQAITETAGLHDSSYLGRLKASGADALDLLNRLSTNGIVNLKPGQGAPTILTTDRGRILDLLGVVNIGEYVLLLTSAGCEPIIMDWLDKYTIMEDLTVADLSAETALFTLCGPRCVEALDKVVPQESVALNLATAPYSVLPTAVAGHDALLIRRPLGALPAVDLLVAAAAGPAVWEALTGSGIPPVGLEAFNTALVQNAVPRHGRELGEAYNPLEAGLIGSVDFAKGCYIGQEVIARLDTYQKVQKYLARFRFSNGAVASEGAGLQLEGRNVGNITSLAAIPATGDLVGLGYLRTALATPGQELALAYPSVGTATVTELPQLFGPGQ